MRAHLLLFLFILVIPTFGGTSVTIAPRNLNIIHDRTEEKIENSAMIVFLIDIYNGLNETFEDLHSNDSCTFIVEISLLGNWTYCHSSKIFIVPGLNLLTIQQNFTDSKIATNVAITIYADKPQVSLIDNLPSTQLNFTISNNTYFSQIRGRYPPDFSTGNSIKIRIHRVNVIQTIQTSPVSFLEIDLTLDIYIPEQINTGTIKGNFIIQTNIPDSIISYRDANLNYQVTCPQKGKVSILNYFIVTIENLNWSFTPNVQITISFQQHPSSFAIQFLPYTLTYSYGEKINETPPDIPNNLKELEANQKICTPTTVRGTTESTQDILINAIIISIFVAPPTIIVIEQINKYYRNKKSLWLNETFPETENYRKLKP